MAEKTVWLLGSGFSKPLGGPLLRDLFRQEWEEDVAAFFPDDDYPGLAKSLPWVQKVFHNGVDYGLWENAEQFMAYVDDAYHGASSAPHRVQILNLINRSHIGPLPRSDTELAAQTAYKDTLTGTFNLKVKRALAAECFRFTMTADCKDERWDPFRAWIRSLEPGRDTVITFNYDLVVEMASDASETGKIEVVRPRPDLAARDVPADKVPLLKLHGSVDWRVTPDQTHFTVIDQKSIPIGAVLKTPDVDIAIAAPGGSKKRFVTSHLAPLWELADRALTIADKVMVVGYSFPDTDPSATDRLLRSLERTAVKSRQIHIVVGADVNMPGSERVASLLRSTSNQRPLVSVRQLNAGAYGGTGLAVVKHPLWTQDFIGRHGSYLAALNGGPV